MKFTSRAEEIIISPGRECHETSDLGKLNLGLPKNSDPSFNLCTIYNLVCSTI